MIFVSHIRKFSMVILHRIHEEIPGYGEREIVPSFVAQFGPGDFTVELLEFAKAKYEGQLHGRTYEIDEVTPVDIVDRLSMYDTDDPKLQREFDEIDLAMEGRQHIDLPRGAKWKPGDMKALVERKLSERAAQSDENFALFVPIPVPPPWPTYEAFPGDADERFDVVVAQGHDLASVLAYEKQQGTRPLMIQMLEERIATEPQPTAPSFVNA